MKHLASRSGQTLTILALALSYGALASETLTRSNGAPVGENQNSKVERTNSPVLLEDVHLVEKLAQFDRERIPERVVHARGTGAHGEFISYGDFADLTKAELFGAKGRKTPVFVRFSTVINASGSPETLRDPRGFATKFYTSEGNWDLVGNNLPVFFIKDAMKFPDMVHSLKPSPRTNQQDPARYWDFFAHHPESTLMTTFLFSPYGIPANLREMDGNGIHAFKFVNKKGEVRYVKFNWKSLQGVRNLTSAQAAAIQANDFNHATRDLYQQIDKGNFPSWELSVQVLRPEQLDDFTFNPLDPTKEWPGVERVKLGKMTLNKVPTDFFRFTEQVGLAPSNLVPGIEGSEDRLLQGRLFSYADTQRYRLGINHQQLEVNRPRTEVRNFNQMGQADETQNPDINFQPNGYDGKAERNNGSLRSEPTAAAAKFRLADVIKDDLWAKTDDFSQPGALWRSFSDAEKDELILNLTGELKAVKNKHVVLRITANALAADEQYGTRLAKNLGIKIEDVRKAVRP